ncbi:hypothetical protein Ae201684P_013254 [Aphanomyces euteiches]|nr:hypothetical protein Ae201684P_013254 [Aphanomyces euteiches]
MIGMLTADKAAKRREYFRDKQRKVPRAERARCAISSWQNTEVDPERTLSWSSIASVFRAEVHRSNTEQESLVQETNERAALALAMQRFVALNLQSSPERPMRNWSCATLLEQPQARKLGKEWLTQQLYHNLETSFQMFSCCGPEEEIYGLDVDVSSEGFTCVEMMQQIWRGTKDSCWHFFQNHYVDLLFLDPSSVSVECTENTKLYRKVTDDGNFFNIFQGNFVEANRLVVVLRQIENDEAFNSERYRQHHSMTWIDVRPLSETHVVIRAIIQYSQFYRKGQGFVSLDEQAKIWKIDLTGVSEKRKRDYLRKRRFCKIMRLKFNAKIMLTRAVADRSNTVHKITQAVQDAQMTRPKPSPWTPVIRYKLTFELSTRKAL